MNRPSEKPEKKKKPYQSPKLLVYGNLTEMTQAAGRKARSDGGRVGTSRFTGK
jgi:hypothetical protein